MLLQEMEHKLTRVKELDLKMHMLQKQLGSFKKRARREEKEEEAKVFEGKSNHKSMERRANHIDPLESPSTFIAHVDRFVGPLTFHPG